MGNDGGSREMAINGSKRRNGGAGGQDRGWKVYLGMEGIKMSVVGINMCSMMGICKRRSLDEGRGRYGGGHEQGVPWVSPGIGKLQWGIRINHA